MDGDLLARGRACGDHIAVLEEALAAERGRREQLVVGMRDAGYSWKAIGESVRLSQSRCAAIVAEAPDPIEVTADGGPLPAGH
jgi:hypothetical protein